MFVFEFKEMQLSLCFEIIDSDTAVVHHIGYLSLVLFKIRRFIIKPLYKCKAKEVEANTKVYTCSSYCAVTSGIDYCSKQHHSSILLTS